MGRFVVKIVALVTIFVAEGCQETVTEAVPAPRVVVSGPAAVEVGQKVRLWAATENGYDSAYRWASSDQSVATVNPLGEVTGVAEGSAVITATGVDTRAGGSWGLYVYQRKEGAAPYVVVGGPVAVAVGKSVELKAQTINGTDSGYKWTSSASGIAVVDAGGVVTGIAPGEAIITATGQDTGASGSWGVHVFEEVVEPQPVVRVVIEGGISVRVGEALQLTARTEGGFDSGYDWSSSDEAVARVDVYGKVLGLAPGEVVISARGKETKVTGTHGLVVMPLQTEVPLEEEWSASGHANAASDAFRHWDASGAIPEGCAKCHSEPGFLDFLGLDGSEEWVVDKPAAIGTVITCKVCHNAKTHEMESVIFPSGVLVSGLGAEARCMQCHQGREYSGAVDKAIGLAGALDEDALLEAGAGGQAVPKSVHYGAAGATLYGAVVMGGYQYANKKYDVKFQHVLGMDTCTACHDPHSLKVRLGKCKACHAGVEGVEDLRNIRMAGSLVDYDGDGSTDEGIYFELDGMRLRLYQAMRLYALEVVGHGITYDPEVFPYFFQDDDGDGEADIGSDGWPIAFSNWSARLLRAAYNYDFAHKDKGAYAHNAKYVIQLLYDAIEDLSKRVEVDMAGLRRDDAPHFAGGGQSWRFWDAQGVVPGACSRCHSGTGLLLYAQTGGNKDEVPVNGMLCSTCHPYVPDFGKQITFETIKFPSGIALDLGSMGSNLCAACHQGLEAKVGVDEKILASGAVDEDAVPRDIDGSPGLSFASVHFAPAATLMGTQALGAYEYAGKTYDGRFSHVNGFTQCTQCHDAHLQELHLSSCSECHGLVSSLEDLKAVRMAASTEDYDGDGDADEGIWGEIAGLQEMLEEALWKYATEVVGTGIVYDSRIYPYFFKDIDGNRRLDAGEATYENRFTDFTPRLLKAAYNYHFAKTDRGAYAHNAKYVIQVLYDSLASLGEKVVLETGNLHRDDLGHFNGTSKSFRHWDLVGNVPAACARCHTSSGFLTYIASGADPVTVQPASFGLDCETCHSGFGDGAPLRQVSSVTFPSGVSFQSAGDDVSFLCMTCHQGTAGKVTVVEALGASQLSFVDPHWGGAGGVLYGGDAHVGYEYDGNEYEGRFEHFGLGSSQCEYCHTVGPKKHVFSAQVSAGCKTCHTEAAVGDIYSLRKLKPYDYDGDGNNKEPLRDELSGIAARLWERMREVASGNGQPIAYSDTEPYYVNDANANGLADVDEGAYTAWTPALMKAAYNYRLYRAEPGAWAHNFNYMVQLLVDSVADLGGDTSGLYRP